MDWYNPYPSHYLHAPSFRLFEADLRLSDRIMMLIQDDQFAQGLSDVLTSSSTEFCTLDGRLLLQAGGDYFRGLIGHLRGKGESHHHLMAGIILYPAKYDMDQIKAELQLIGWREATRQDLSVLNAIISFDQECP